VLFSTNAKEAYHGPQGRTSTATLGECMSTGFRPRAAFAIAALACAPATLQAADAALVYNKTYQCGKEIIQVSRCRRDSDTPDMPATVDADNFCQVYYLDRPKNGIGGTAFGIELRSELEQRLRGCGALAGGIAVAASPRATTAPAPVASTPANSKQQAAAAEYEAGLAAYKANDYQRAIESYRKSIAIQPMSLACDALGTTYLALNRHAEAEAAYRQAISLKADNSNALAGLGMTLQATGRAADAIAPLVEATRLAPKEAGFWNALGNAYYSAKNLADAVRAYQQAVSLLPTEAVYRGNLGDALRRTGKPDQALVELNESLRLKPDFHSAANAIGLIHFEAKRYAEALPFFRKASQLLPRTANYIFNEGVTLANLGRLAEARKVQQALVPLSATHAKDLLENIDRQSGRLTLAMKPVRPPGLANPKIELVWVKPGSFTMGGGFADTVPAHPVTIATGFFIGKYEVTQAQWKALMGGNPSSYPDCGDNCPVEQVTWEAAQVFVKWLNDGNDGYVYRLPSEAEWEYAFRAGTTGPLYAEGEIGWNGSNAGNKTHPVGLLKPNALGLYDIAGNVGEWCSDWYHKNYEGAPADGSPWLAGGDARKRVARGGTFVAPFTSMTATMRIPDALDYATRTNGLRVVAVKKKP